MHSDPADDLEDVQEFQDILLQLDELVFGIVLEILHRIHVDSVLQVRGHHHLSSIPLIYLD
jgi:hypothetical protein